MTVTSFPNNFLRLCYRYHFVGQLKRPSTHLELTVPKDLN